MSPGKNEDCNKCEAHMAWEERLKVLDNIPELMTYMNQERGGKRTAKYIISLAIGVPFTILLFLIAGNRSDVFDIRTSTQQQITAIAAQVTAMNSSAWRIEQNVAVMKTTFEMYKEQADKEHTQIRRDMTATAQNQINLERNSGRKQP